MAIPKFTLYKHVKPDSDGRNSQAAWHSTSKVKPNVALVNGVEETHREGSLEVAFRRKMLCFNRAQAHNAVVLPARNTRSRTSERTLPGSGGVADT